MSAAQAGAQIVQPIKLDLKELEDAPARRADRRRLATSLVACLMAHAAILFILDPRPASESPIEEAIPVEVVVEEPPPPEPEPEQKPQEEEPQPPAEAQPQSLEEKPANDFARATDQDEQDGKDAPPPEAQAQSEPQAQPEAPPVEEKAEDIAPEPAPQPQPMPRPTSPAARMAQQFAAMPPLPDLEFKMPARRSNEPRGTAEPNYLSTLYGRIMKQMRAPKAPPGARNSRGRVVFTIRGDGRIFQEAIVIPSGIRELDAAALAAVRRAAPYPPPPLGGPVSIRFDYGAL